MGIKSSKPKCDITCMVCDTGIKCSCEKEKNLDPEERSCYKNKYPYSEYKKNMDKSELVHVCSSRCQNTYTFAKLGL